MSNEREYRRNAGEYLAAGGGLVGAGQYANYRTEKHLKNSGKLGLWDATKARKLSGTHARYMASKFGSRSLQVTGLPLAAAGAYQLAKPQENRRLNLKQDVVKPVARNVVLADQVKRGAKKIAPESSVEKATDTEKIYSAKRRAKNLSRISGTLGLAALATRSPEIAAAVTRNKKVVTHFPKFAEHPKVTGLMAHEPKATKMSNTLGIGAIGVGSAGSFNFARLQGLENKRDKTVVKALNPEQISNAERLLRRDAIINAHKLRRMTIEQRRNAYRARLEVLSRKSQIQKRDDAFLRQYRDRISPEAEKGYKYLKSGVNSRRASAVAEGGLGAGLVGYAFKEARGGKPGLAALTATGGLLSIRDARANAQAAKVWNAKKKAIQNRAYQRARDGEYGRGRNVDLAKALVKAPQFGLARPKGIMRKPGLRDSYVMRTRSGKMVSVRGSVG